MTTMTIRVRFPARSVTVTVRRPVWWEWVKLAGALGLLGLTTWLIPAFPNLPHPVVFAVVLHLATDFTAQSTEVGLHKYEQPRLLIAHSLTSGFPLAVAGLASGELTNVLTWTVINIVTHWLIDKTEKFGLGGNNLWGAVLDQLAHLAVILLLTLS